MPVTQADVARRAGVSQRTVSNVVNKYPHVSDDVASRVTEAIEALGYTPSHAARSLRSGRSRVIQLVVPELDVPYFAELARGVVRCAEDRGYSVMLRQSLGDGERERDALEGSVTDFAEGTILSAVGSIEQLVSVGRTRPPVVLIGEHSGMGLVDHIGIDDRAAARAATAHLLASGRRRIAFLGADPAGALRMARLRFDGYAQALADAGDQVDEGLVISTGGYHSKDGAEGAAHLFQLEPGRRPDAIFCVTDLLALGALRAAHECGVRVPSQVAVMGFDGLDAGLYSVPTLSTIAPDKGEIARLAVETLVERIAGRTSAAPQPAPRDLSVPFSLVVRESTR